MRHDPILLESARRGDFAAVEQLLALCRPELYQIASRNALSAAVDSADRASLPPFCQRIGARGGVASLPIWALSIARRECRRLYRSMRGQGASPMRGHPMLAHTSQIDLRRDLAAAIQSLPDKYREAIILRDFEESSITEIAGVLSLTRGAVKSRIHRGRQMVQEYLKD